MSDRLESAPRPEISLTPTEGWHCLHVFYRFDRMRFRTLGPAERADGCREFCDLLSPGREGGPVRMQTFLVMGHKADFGIMMLDPDPLKLDAVHQDLLYGSLGPAICPVWSFVSLTEVSEYLPDEQRYAHRLEEEGLKRGEEEFERRLAQYSKRLEYMRRQRLEPDLPSWPAYCFYPMNKRRQPEANWFLLDFATRERLMAEHGESGIAFAGKVTQLVTVGIGLEDWEWGVSLWARNPQFLKDIVYRMRYDEASAKYAEFGPFYSGYLMPPREILDRCRIRE